MDEKYEKDDEAKCKRIGVYQDFKDYIAEFDSDFERHKVQTAESLVFNNESLDMLDLKEKVKELEQIVFSKELIASFNNIYFISLFAQHIKYLINGLKLHYNPNICIFC